MTAYITAYMIDDSLHDSLHDRSVIVSVRLVHDAVLLLLVVQLLVAGKDLGAKGLFHGPDGLNVDVVRHVHVGYLAPHVLQERVGWLVLIVLGVMLDHEAVDVTLPHHEKLSRIQKLLAPVPM